MYLSVGLTNQRMSRQKLHTYESNEVFSQPLIFVKYFGSPYTTLTVVVVETVVDMIQLICG